MATHHGPGGLDREPPVPDAKRDHVLGQGEGLPWVGEERGTPLHETNCPMPEANSPGQSVGLLLSPPCSPVPPSPEPQITSPPYDTWNITGQDVIFGCEVFAYPMASIEWRKDGMEMLLPGDDPHISVQVSSARRTLDPDFLRACGQPDLRAFFLWGRPRLLAWE